MALCIKDLRYRTFCLSCITTQIWLDTCNTISTKLIMCPIIPLNNQAIVEYMTLKLISYVTSMDCLCLHLNIPECHIRDLSYFDIPGAQYHDMILYHCIDILPYRYVSKIPDQFLALAVDKMHGRGPSNEMRPQLQPKKAR